MSLSKNKKPVNENSMNDKPMNDFIYQSIMNEYNLSPFMYMEDSKIQRAYLLNDEVMLRKILECEY